MIIQILDFKNLIRLQLDMRKLNGENRGVMGGPEKSLNRASIFQVSYTKWNFLRQCNRYKLNLSMQHLKFIRSKKATAMENEAFCYFLLVSVRLSQLISKSCTFWNHVQIHFSFRIKIRRLRPNSRDWEFECATVLSGKNFFRSYGFHIFLEYFSLLSWMEEKCFSRESIF